MHSSILHVHIVEAKHQVIPLLLLALRQVTLLHCTNTRRTLHSRILGISHCDLCNFLDFGEKYSKSSFGCFAKQSMNS